MKVSRTQGVKLAKPQGASRSQGLRASGAQGLKEVANSNFEGNLSVTITFQTLKISDKQRRGGRGERQRP